MIEFTIEPSIRLLNYDPIDILPMMLSEDNPKPAKEQLHRGYLHGGGWRPVKGFEFDTATRELRYPGDPPLSPVASAKLRSETILIFPHEWVMVLQPSGDYEVCRMD